VLPSSHINFDPRINDGHRSFSGFNVATEPICA
jgi:hypothetical protein